MLASSTCPGGLPSIGLSTSTLLWLTGIIVGGIVCGGGRGQVEVSLHNFVCMYVFSSSNIVEMRQQGAIILYEIGVPPDPYASVGSSDRLGSSWQQREREKILLPSTPLMKREGRAKGRAMARAVVSWAASETLLDLCGTTNPFSFNSSVDRDLDYSSRKVAKSIYKILKPVARVHSKLRTQKIVPAVCDPIPISCRNVQWCKDFCSGFDAKYFGVQWGRE